MIIKSLTKEQVQLVNRVCAYYTKLGVSDIIRGNIEGFYALRKDKVIRFCVHPDWRDQGIGTNLHEDLIKIARQHGYKLITMVIHEEAESLLWFRNHWGWEGVKVIKEAFKGRDGYLLQRKII